MAVKDSSYRQAEDFGGISCSCIATFSDYGSVECKATCQEIISTIICRLFEQKHEYVDDVIYWEVQKDIHKWHLIHFGILLRI